jgi:hypothetical protein
MLVTPKDLQELADDSGSLFQRFVTALVVEEALACGLHRTDIDADYRTRLCLKTLKTSKLAGRLGGRHL